MARKTEFTSDDFAEASRFRQDLRRTRRLLRIEWEEAKGPLGPIIANLRARATSARGRAWAFLVALFLAIAAGGTWFVGVPVWSNIQNVRLQTQRETLQTQIAARDRDIADQQKSFLTLRDDVVDRLRSFGDWYRIYELSNRANVLNVEFSSSGEGIILALEDFNDAILLRRTHSEPDWRRFNLPLPSFAYSGVSFSDTGIAVISGILGNYYTRASDSSSWQKHMPLNVRHNFNGVSIGPNDEAVIVGNNGQYYLVKLRGERFEPGKIRGVTTNLNRVAFSRNGEAIIVGDQGKIFLRAPGDEEWKPHDAPGMTVDLHGIAFDPNGEAIIVGDKGTILSRASTDREWNPHHVPGLSVDLRGIAFDRNGNAGIVGEDGTILLRTLGHEDWKHAGIPDLLEDLNDIAFDLNGDAVVVGRSGTIYSKMMNVSRRVGAAQDIVELESGLNNIPVIERSEGEIVQANQIAARISELTAQKEGFEAELRGLAAVVAERSLETAARAMERYLATCAPGESDAARVAACSEALRESGLLAPPWWQELAEKAPGGVLLLFLLATLGGLYRYSVRVAAFYDARADALVMVEGQLDDGGDIDVERVKRLSAALGAETLEFRSQATPVDKAVELAKAMVGQMKKDP